MSLSLEFMMPETHITDAVPATSLLALTQTAIGCGVGLLIARKLAPTRQTQTAAALLSVGILSSLTLAFGLFSKRWNRPESRRGMRRRLASIRDDSGLAGEAEIF